MCVVGRISAYLGGLFFLAALPSAAMASSAAPPPLEVYGSLPQTEAVELSADGNILAIVETEGDRRMLSIERVDGRPVAKVGIGDLKLSGLEWAGSDYVVVYMHSTARLSIHSRHEQEFTQGFIISAKDGGVKPLLRASGDYLPAVFGHHGVMKVDGRWYGFYGVIPTERSMDGTDRSGFFKQRYPDLYKIDLETGAVARVTRGSINLRSWVLDGNGQVIADSEYEPNNGNWKIFLPGSPDKPLASGNSPFGFQLVGLSRTPGTILVSEGGGNGSILELHLDSGKTETFLPSGKAMQLIHAHDTHL